ncbi:hypothetical protein HQ533_05630 [Candidatus Woesearchaeota archaeon]|nr:hypothetical protein [Candidatus Woesearchaeota archaeon]
MTLDERVLAFIMAGGRGTRLEVLTRDRSKPAVPILGPYRIIDAVASNVANSDIPIMLVGTQFRPVSLNTHMGYKETWGFDGKEKHMEILSPYQDELANLSFDGTADSVRKNMSRIEHYDPDTIIVLGGDHIYSANYTSVIKTHKHHSADMTIMTTGVEKTKAPDFGVLKVDDNGRVLAFEEKPKDRKIIDDFELSERAKANLGIRDSNITHLASMGNYVFSKDSLKQALNHEGTDFGEDIIPAVHRDNGEIYVYFFDGYWRDVGKIPDFFATNREFVHGTPINLTHARFRTYLRDLPSARIMNGATVKGGSIITPGSEFYRGSIVKGSVLGHQVILEEGAKVFDSILFGADRNDYHNGLLRREFSTRIGRHSVVEKAIIDKNVQIGSKVDIRPENGTYEERVSRLEELGLIHHDAKNNVRGDFYLDKESGILVIGKQNTDGLLIPDGYKI